MNTASVEYREPIKALPRTHDGVPRELPEMTIQRPRTAADAFDPDADGENLS